MRERDAAKPRRDQIPEIVINRLPIYARTLAYLEEEHVEVVSSLELGARLRVTPAQIRKDLSYFGEFGKQGTGYNVKYLLGEIRQILGLDREWRMALVGVGHLGRAILAYRGFIDQGFRVVAAFDNDTARIGSHIQGISVRDVAELPQVIAREGIQIAILAVPASEAQAQADTLVKCGVKAILNYAPVNLHVPPEVKVRHVDPVVALQAMTYHLKSLPREVGLEAGSG